MSSINVFVERIKAKYDHVDALINNAGIFHMALIQRQTTNDGFEEHFQVNFLAPTLLTYQLLPLLYRSEVSF